MKYILSVMLVTFVILSCKKEKTTLPQPPEDKVLLKDIVIPNLPSPYYHFEYGITDNVSHVSFAGGLRMYDVMYSGDKIVEFRNNTAVNKDRLQILYDESGRVSLVKYIDEAGTTFKRCFLTYASSKLNKLEWERNVGVGFGNERTITLTYQPDGNLSDIEDHRHAIGGQTEATYNTHFENYDTKGNPDGFSLLHENNEHLLLLPVQLQKNNPLKVIRSGDGINYTIDYTYTYNGKNYPSAKQGEVAVTNGPDAGQHWQTSASFSYYP